MVQALEQVTEDAEQDDVLRDRWEFGYRPSKNAIQRRVDQFTRRIGELKEQNGELRRENQELRTGLTRALALIDRLRARKTCQTANNSQ